MENNDRQQDGGNFAEARGDILVGSSDGEAVLEDAGQGDWGGEFLNWDLPQEEEQGFVEGEYAPGSEYDPGFIPEDKLYKEPVDAPAAADPWGADPWGDAANLEGFEEFGQEQPSGEEAADVVGKRLPPWMVRTAAGAGAEEVDQSAPEGLAAESEDPAASADLSDPALYDTGVADPWGSGRPTPGTVEQEQEHTFNPLFSASWEDLGVPSPGTAEQEQEEPSFAPLQEDLNAQPSGMIEQEEAPAFGAPWEDVSTAPDVETGIFTAGWDSVPGTPPEGQEDVPNTGFEEILKSFDVWSEPNGMAEEITAAGDIWKDTTEGLFEDVGGAFEGVGESIEDVFDDNIF